MGNYDDVARREKERQEKGRGRASFDPVVYGEEKRCPNCWTKLTKFEVSEGKTVDYCATCYAARASV